MPSLVRKLLIFAAVDGLILQPAPPRNHPPSTQQAIKIDWKGNVVPLLKDRREEETGKSLEAWGVVGLLKVASTNFLISISSREQVAQIRGKPVYTISDVALIPLASQQEAEKAITLARDAMAKQARTAETADSGDEESDDDGAGTVSDLESLSEDDPSGSMTVLKDPVTNRHERTSSVGQDVIQNKGLYGRFAQRWFSQKGWSADKRRNQGLSSEEELARKKKEQGNTEDSTSPTKDKEGIAEELQKDQKVDEGIQANEEAPPAVKPGEIPKALGEAHNDTSVVLLPKILRTAKLYFGSKSFFFSYDLDLSKRLSLYEPALSSSRPLFQQFDPLYFWNQHLTRPLIDAGQHSFVLPLIQGFVGQRAFTVDVPAEKKAQEMDAAASLKAVLDKHDDSKPSKAMIESDAPKVTTKDFLITIVSRRSVKRAGLRYLRRGIDESGNVANSVETEQILCLPTWDTTNDKIYSFTQYRGSIPLFFHQSPYSLKPVVEFDGTPAMNAAAFKAHFANLTSRYGSVQAASLVDKHGNEAKLGEAFEAHAQSLNSSGGVDGAGRQIGFEWFDFHHACRGMKFENVSILMDTLGPFLTSHGWTVQSGSELTETQSGILRTNCMDCLDRTNVTQSATARIILEAQLASQNIAIDLQTDPKTAWFNTLWADNGDAISRQYSGTAALKGDYTRTRRRQISGALTDFGLTLTRYYNNIVNDYFAQALIDFLLGRATESIFADFEADMSAKDYKIDLRRVRQGAIERCVDIAIEDHREDFLAGWTLSAPAEGNTVRSLPFEELVLLLTERAIYVCRLDWSTEKVKAFERIELADVKSIQRGTYITSTLAPRYMDEEKNVGFVVRYNARKEGMVRHNTRSLDSAASSQPSHEQDKQSSQQESRRDSEDEHDDPHHAESKDEVDPLANEKTERFLAFKALPPKSSFATGDSADSTSLISERETVRQITEEVVRVVNRKRGDGKAPKGGQEGKRGGMEVKDGEEGEGGKIEEQGEGSGGVKRKRKGGELVVEEKDVISLTEAKKATGWVEQLGYNLKRLVWT